MPRYRYAGPGPVPDPENELVHPGDVREYDKEPDWGPWELVADPPPEPESGPGPRRIGDDVPIGGAPVAAPLLPVPPAKPEGK